MKVKVSKVKLSDADIRIGSIVSYLRRLYTVVSIGRDVLVLVERAPDDLTVDSVTAPVHLDFVVVPRNQVAISIPKLPERMRADECK